MNTIFSKDGILAFIGTKSEFGRYTTELARRREVNSTGFWTSLPEHTILATLGLCLNTSITEGRSLAFHGSPRTLMLGVMIDYHKSDLLRDLLLPTVERQIELNESLDIYQYVTKDVLDYSLFITPNELQDSLADLTAYLGIKAIPVREAQG